MSKDVDGQMAFDGETVSVPPKTHKPVEHGPAKAKHRVFNLKFVPGEGFVWFPGNEFVEREWDQPRKE